MKKHVTLALALFFTVVVFGQDVKLTEIIAADNSLRIMAEPIGAGNFTVWIKITKASNVIDAKQTPYEIVRTINTKSEIVLLKPSNHARKIELEYEFDWINGRVNALPDLGFLYRLPVANDMTTMIKSVTAGQVDMSHINASNFRMWHFMADPGEPIFAIRRGIVLRAEDGGHPDSKDDSWANALVAIEHADGTQAIYLGLKGGSLGVKVGDKVLPSQRIASAGKNFDMSKGVRIGVYYYISNRNKGVYPNMKIQTDFINPLYSIKGGNAILEDGAMAVSKVSSKIIKSEVPKRSVWQRMQDIINGN